MREVFISYKSNDPELGNNDGTVAKELCEALEAAGITCWMAPRDIPYGVDYDDCIVEAIETCDVLLVVFSRHTISSKYVYEEVRIAYDNEKFIIRFKLDETKLKGKWNLRLGAKHWVDATEDYHKIIPGLIADLQKRLFSPGEHEDQPEGISDELKNAEIVKTNPSSKQTNDVKVTNEIKSDYIKEKAKGKDDSICVLNTPSIESITVNDVSFNMVLVEGDKFIMGATPEQGNDAYNIERPSHQVMLSSYYIGETQVTQELWQVVMGKNPSRFKGDLQCPVERVSWNDCKEFIFRLNKLTQMRFRLPTEAEWEFAARGGSKSKDYKYAGSNNLDEVGWFEDNSEGKTHPVRSKKANELGLFDMCGNVYEWCWDWYGNYSSDSQINPEGPLLGSYRLARGGCWTHSIRQSRVTSRDAYIMSSRHSYLGLRLAYDKKRK